METQYQASVNKIAWEKANDSNFNFKKIIILSASPSKEIPT